MRKPTTWQETLWFAHQHERPAKAQQHTHTKNRHRPSTPLSLMSFQMKCSLLNRTIEITVNPLCAPYQTVDLFWWKIPEGHAKGRKPGSPEERRWHFYNTTREKAGNEGADLFIPNGVFNLELLRIHKSDCNDILKTCTRCIKESSPGSSWHPTSQIRISVEAQVLVTRRKY